jgi:heme peroxidase
MSYEEAREALKKGQDERARELIKPLLAAKPDGKVYALAGLLEFRAEDYREAKRFYGEAVSTDRTRRDWREMHALAKANATAKINEPVPEPEDFNGKALVAPPRVKDGDLPRPPHSPRPNCFKRLQLFLGEVLGAGFTVLMNWAINWVGRTFSYRGKVWTRWYDRWLPLKVLTLAYMRDELNAHNLISTYPAGTLIGFQEKGQRPPVGVSCFRTADGSWNNLADPKEGAAGTRFLRNVELSAIRPEEGPELLTPNPREISLSLLTRPDGADGQPEVIEVKFLNLLAASWIQFMIHDWVNHGEVAREGVIKVPLERDDFAQERYLRSEMEIGRTQEDPTRPSEKRPAATNSTSEEPPATSSTNEQPPNTTSTSEEPPAAGSIDEEPPATTSTTEQPPAASPTDEEPPATTSTTEEPPAASPIDEEPPATVPTTEKPAATRPLKEPAHKTFINEVTHWWDGSQIYGSDQETQNRLRSHRFGKMRLNSDGTLPVELGTLVEEAGFRRSWWVGLSMLHTLFVREHNAICDMLYEAYPTWDDNRLFNVARLINAAEMAKIHSVEWTPAILPNRALDLGLNTNWYGLLTFLTSKGAARKTLSKVNIRNAEIGGIVGNPINKHNCPFGLTEEFVEVYRLHSLLPEQLLLHKRRQDPAKEVFLPQTRQSGSPEITTEYGLSNLFYSFGNQHPGALVLNNYPRFLQQLSVSGKSFLDVGTVDILRARERGVPRYNEFRRQLGLNEIRSFDDLTDCPTLRKKLKALYEDDVEKLDLLIGTLAEGHRPNGFGFGETLFQIFILNASRRLQADRFYTDCYNEDVYTPEGLRWIDRSDLKTVILRHYPDLAESGLANIKNAFEPWDEGPELDPDRHPLREWDAELKPDPWRGDAYRHV